MAHYDLFLMAGQSNMGGFGVRAYLDPVEQFIIDTDPNYPGQPDASSDTSIVYSTNQAGLFNSSDPALEDPLDDKWGSYIGEGQAYPSGNNGGDSGYGMEVSFCRKWGASNPSGNLAVVKVAAGGTAIGEWLEGQPLNDILVRRIEAGMARLTAAEHTYTVKAFLWMQGESGAQNQTEAGDYADDVRTLRTQIRSVVGLPNLPFGVGRIGEHNKGEELLLAIGYTEPQLPAATAGVDLRRADQVTVGTEPFCFWWDTDNLPILSPESQPAYHHTGPGYLAMGERAWEAYANATSGKRRLSIASGSRRLILQVGA